MKKPTLLLATLLLTPAFAFAWEGTEIEVGPKNAARTTRLAKGGEELGKGNPCLKKMSDELNKALESSEMKAAKQAHFPQGTAEKTSVPGFVIMADQVGSSNAYDLKIRFRTGEPYVSSSGSGVPFRVYKDIRTVVLAQGKTWKELLKEGKCTVKKEGLIELLGPTPTELQKEKAALEECVSRHEKVADGFKHLQRKTNEYVPEEWLEQVASNLTKKKIEQKSFKSVAECQKSLAELEESASILLSAVSSVSEKHGVQLEDETTKNLADVLKSKAAK